jgi:hypothetical protein
MRKLVAKCANACNTRIRSFAGEAGSGFPRYGADIESRRWAGRGLEGPGVLCRPRWGWVFAGSWLGLKGYCV